MQNVHWNEPKKPLEETPIVAVYGYNQLCIMVHRFDEGIQTCPHVLNMVDDIQAKHYIVCRIKWQGFYSNGFEIDIWVLPNRKVRELFITQ